MWLEPVAAAVVLGLALFINSGDEWPYMWVIDVVSCTGAALSRRWPVAGAVLTAVGLAVWLPFPGVLPSISGMSFYINIFAAARMDLTWKLPLALGFGGLAYLSLVRNAVQEASYRWSTSILLIVVLVVAWAGGTAFRFADKGIQRERESGQQRLQDLQVSLARELHDSVAQTLSSAAMRANIVMSDPALSPLAKDQLERIADECRSSAHDLRQLLSALRDAPERDVTPGPLADVESLRQAVNAQAERLRGEGFIVSLDLRITKLSAARCQTLAAITVEAANNIVKHAKRGTRCTFSIVQGTENVVGEFTNVRQNSKSVRQGFGLTGVQERLTLLDGTCSVQLKNGRWVLQATLPLGMETNGSQSATFPVAEPLFAEKANS